MIKQITDETLKSDYALEVLRDLPEWFGIEESLLAYVEDVKRMMFWVVLEDDNICGFLALNETSEDAVDIHVIGVKQKYHSKGMGKELVKAAEKYAQESYSLMQVKTIQEGVYDIYDRSIAFYKSCGFKKLEVFPTLWDENNPCLIMVKSLQRLA